MRFVIVESPFASNHITLPSGSEYAIREETNISYARACMHECLTKYGEAPYASHLLYTQPGVLDDKVLEERELGISAGLEIGRKADLRIFFVDRGVSSGMCWAYRFALEINQPCEIRSLGGLWDIGWRGNRTDEEIFNIMRG